MAALPQIEQLLAIMARLRDPEGGCPWDLQADFASIAPYTIEEAYEVADAIARGDMPGLREELGDLLLQVVFHAQMAHEAGHFDFESVAQAINEKMIRRHPHIFAAADIRSAESQAASWENIKAEERRGKRREGILADIPAALPALTRAQKLQARAAHVGFDWPEIGGVLAKLCEELDEVRAELAHGGEAETLADEIGDLLFSVVNLARYCKLDAEEALRRANRKFTRRFEAVEDGVAASGKSFAETSLDTMETFWNRAKEAEKIS